MNDLTLNARLREGLGKGHSRRLRAQGMIPASVYGENTEPVAVAVNAKEVGAILRSEAGHNTIFKLAFDGAGEGGDSANVIIKDWQVDPVRGRLLHIDLKRLSMTTVTQVNVPVEIVGDPEGVRLEGGLLDVQMRELEVECLPGDIPDHIKVDVSKLHIGDHVRVADLEYDRDKITVLTNEDVIIAGVLMARKAEEAATTALPETGETVEPEVITKSKEE